MKKDIKYIVKRILIGTGIAILLLLIKGTAFINTYALSPGSFSNNQNYISYSLPDSNDLYNQNDIYWTNVFPDTTFFAVNPISMTYDITEQKRPLDNPDSGVCEWCTNRIDNYLFNKSFQIEGLTDGPYQGDYFWGIYKLNLNFNTFTYEYDTDHSPTPFATAFPIAPGRDYSVLLEIQASEGATLYGNSDTMQLYDDTVVIKANWYKTNETEANNNNFMNNIDIINLAYLPPRSLGEGAADDIAYIKLDFRLKSNISSSDYYYIYISHISFDSGTIVGVNSQRATPFVFNTNSGPGSHRLFRLNQLSWIYGGDILVSPISNPINGSDVNPDLDSISQEDLQIKNKLRTCAATDIGCHLQNLQDYLWYLFVRIGNFFKSIINAFNNLLINLFVPNLANLDSHFTDLRDLFNDRLGFLVESFNVLTYFKDAFLSIQATDTFSFSGVSIPIWNVEIIPSFTYSFSSILSNDILNQAHNILYLVLNGLLILGFIKFCYNNVIEILGGVGNDIG